ncbi:hypothetical protein SDC9_110296 [bioreactor metagenome]|uniref:Uncharacterized protein n=1 Tax=bioreactor metagenome TaxID=1076179 RepID=A0A645BE72_9ZZZZ
MFADHLHAHHGVTFDLEPHAGHAARGTPHRADLVVVLVEQAGHAEPGRKQDFVAVFTDSGADEIVILFDDQGTQPGPAEVLEQRELAFLDVSPARSHDDILVRLVEFVR